MEEPTMEQQGQSLGRILVIDDEAPVGRVVHSWLTRKGYYVRHAMNFDQVCRFFDQEEFDLVTLDIMMPEVDGLQVLKWLREHHPDIGVIMATALGDLELVIEAMRLGAINYLIKPFNMELITAEVERGMDRQRLIRENHFYQLELERKVEERTQELQAVCAQLARQLRELEGRDRLVRFQMSVHTLEEAYAEVLEVLQQVSEVQQAILYRPDPEGRELAAVAGLGLSEPGRLADTGSLAEVPGVPLDGTDGLQSQAYAGKKLVAAPDGQVAVPVLYRDEVLGVLWIGDPRKQEADQEALGTLWRLSGEIALVLRGALVAEELESGSLSFGDLEDAE
jgi:DNA-binding response OmpR family regulator